MCKLRYLKCHIGYRYNNCLNTFVDNQWEVLAKQKYFCTTLIFQNIYFKFELTLL